MTPSCDKLRVAGKTSSWLVEMGISTPPFFDDDACRKERQADRDGYRGPSQRETVWIPVPAMAGSS